MNAPRPIRLLLVEDHVLFRTALIHLLQSEPGFELAGEAQSGPEAVQQATTVRPDVILMDLRLPAMDGLEATRRIIAVWPEARIVILTASESDDTLFEAIRSGAQGYLLKDVDAESLFQTVKAVARGEASLPGPLAAKVLAEFARPAGRAPVGSPGQRLSRREQEILGFVAEGKSNKEIAAALAIAENTVKSHLKSILAKLHLENRVQAATYALRQGHRNKPPNKTNG
jgi:DNA-binding NarL/FixJ family response regulator